LSNFWVLLTYDDQHLEETKIVGQEELVIKEEPKMTNNKKNKTKTKTEQTTQKQKQNRTEHLVNLIP
jgi:hypothetical protein